MARECQTAECQIYHETGHNLLNTSHCLLYWQQEAKSHGWEECIHSVNGQNFVIYWSWSTFSCRPFFSRCGVLCVHSTVYYTNLLALFFIHYTCIFHNVFFLVIAGCPATTVQCGICEVILSPSWRKCIIIMLMWYVYHYSVYIALWRLHIRICNTYTHAVIILSWEVGVLCICKSCLVKCIVNTWVGLSCNLGNLLALSLSDCSTRSKLVRTRMVPPKWSPSVPSCWQGARKSLRKTRRMMRNWTSSNKLWRMHWQWEGAWYMEGGSGKNCIRSWREANAWVLQGLHKEGRLFRCVHVAGTDMWSVKWTFRYIVTAVQYNCVLPLHHSGQIVNMHRYSTYRNVDRGAEFCCTTFYWFVVPVGWGEEAAKGDVRRSKD